jgi:hypothetical protein
VILFSTASDLPWHTASLAQAGPTEPVSPPLDHRTPGISCEAVPAFDRGGAGMRRHLNKSHTSLPCLGAAESFVSFIPLFGGPGSGRTVDASSWPTGPSDLECLRTRNALERLLSPRRIDPSRPPTTSADLARPYAHVRLDYRE